MESSRNLRYKDYFDSVDGAADQQSESENYNMDEDMEDGREGVENVDEDTDEDEYVIQPVGVMWP